MKMALRGATCPKGWRKSAQRCRPGIEKDPSTAGQARMSGQPWSMGSCSHSRAGLVACAVLGATVGEASARADAGQPASTTSARARDLAFPARGQTAFQQAIAPSHLPESVQEQLRERAGASPSAEPPTPAPPGAPRALSETARRIGEARMRRVQAFDTSDGVTILSNRFSELPNPRQVAVQAPSPPPRREGETVIAPPALTETRSLRPTVPSASMPRDTDLRGWLWPLAALLAFSAALGTLLYRKTSAGKVGANEARR